MSLKSSPSEEVYRANMYYGIGKTLQMYSGIDSSVKACIEHGLYFGSYYNNFELESSGLPALLSFSDIRLGHIRKRSSVPMCLIGPYIAYSTDYLDDLQFQIAKEQLGKTLLVFPSHSIESTDKWFDVDLFVDEIIRIKTLARVDTVLISVYFHDLGSTYVSRYEDAGFTVVTSGLREDVNFLRRQRTLIELSDLTMSNSVGTHVGYCVYLKKPHYIFNQKIACSFSTGADEIEMSESAQDSARIEKHEVERYFSSFSHNVSMSQREICGKYWGFDYVLLPEEMALLLGICQEAFGESPARRQEQFRKIVRNHQNGSQFAKHLNIDLG